GTELGKDIPIPWGIKALSFLANPLPRNLNVKPFDDLQLEVLGFLPHVRIEQIEAAKEKEFGFPAIKLELNLRQTGHNQPRWMSLVQDASL
ncbi:MAG TPA: hypothetical protein PKA06_00915, partial [Gemmatales bacterium]|nr:hypothetical protein [Gemmatales bacterium]